MREDHLLEEMMPESAGPRGPDPVSGAGDLSVIERRKIEAMVLGPMLRAFSKRFGDDATRETARKVIVQIAREQGAEFAKFTGADSLTGFAASKEPWRRSGALEVDEIKKSESEYSFNVTRCRFAEMYREMGLADLGSILSCERDGSLCQGFSQEIALTRTQTIMQGAPFCDFRYTYEPAPGGGGGRGDA